MAGIPRCWAPHPCSSLSFAPKQSYFRPFIFFAALCWTLPAVSRSLLFLGAHADPSTAEWKGRITSCCTIGLFGSGISALPHVMTGTYQDPMSFSNRVPQAHPSIPPCWVPSFSFSPFLSLSRAPGWQQDTDVPLLPHAVGCKLAEGALCPIFQISNRMLYLLSSTFY